MHHDLWSRIALALMWSVFSFNRFEVYVNCKDVNTNTQNHLELLASEKANLNETTPVNSSVTQKHLLNTPNFLFALVLRLCDFADLFCSFFYTLCWFSSYSLKIAVFVRRTLLLSCLLCYIQLFSRKVSAIGRKSGRGVGGCGWVSSPKAVALIRNSLQFSDINHTGVIRLATLCDTINGFLHAWQ